MHRNIHGGELKVETKEGEGSEFIIKLPLSESQIRRIIGLHGFTWSGIKSVKSINPCESAVQTSYDIVKAHGGELKVETKEGKGSEFIIQLPFV
jgi:signal transduction histidine kinase